MTNAENTNQNQGVLVVEVDGQQVTFQTPEEFAGFLVSKGGNLIQSVAQANEAFAKLAAAQQPAVEQPAVEQQPPVAPVANNHVTIALEDGNHVFASVQEMATFLIGRGVDVIQAATMAQQAFATLETPANGETPTAEQTPQQPAQPQTPAQPQPQPQAQPQATPQPAAQPAKTEENGGSKMKDIKEWFKKAADRFTLHSDKDHLIATLAAQKYKDGVTDAEKAEIDAFIKKLQEDKDNTLWDKKVLPAVAKLKGWTIDGTGKLADTLYVTGEYANKGATGLTKVTGSAVVKVGQAVVKIGEFVEEHAGDVGKLVESPFKLTGDAIKTLNGQGTGKPEEKPATETPATPAPENK